MIRRTGIKFISLLLAGFLLCGIPTYADELPVGTGAEELLGNSFWSTDAAPDVPDEAAYAGEISEESSADTISGEAAYAGEIPEESAAEAIEDVNEDVPEAAEEAVIPREADAFPESLFPGMTLPEELAGAGWYYDLEPTTTYYFSCANVADYRCYMYTVSETGTYHLDLAGSTGKMLINVYSSEDNISMDKTNDWTGYYYGVNLHVYMKLKAGTKYVFEIYPDTDRKDGGRIRLRKITNELKSAVVKPISNKYLAVGNTDEGAWHVNDDGTKDKTVWEFITSKILSLYQIVVTYTDGTKYTWTYAKDGGYLGKTNIQLYAAQETEGWSVGEKAYCTIHLAELAPIKVEIPYLWFKDVQDPSHAFYKAIYWAASKGITKGYPDNTFGIDKTCTRGEAVMFLWRYMGQPSPKYTAESPFSDVTSSHAYYRAILWAAQNGITKGYSNGTFGVNKKCTRGAIMMFIWRAKGKPSPTATTKSPFSDVAKTHAYYNAVSWASQQSIAKGYSDGTFGINKDCTRGAIVTFLYRI